MSLEQLEKLRRFELKAILARIQKAAPKGAHVLDIGAGTGWQAKIVADADYSVEAIDKTTSSYVRDRVFPITDYDGHRIPFPDDTFDVVYSSNVLEHVAHVDAFQGEIRRVLKPDGVAIHVVPSATWRFWSNPAHYCYIAKRVVERLLGTDQGATEQTDFAPQNCAGKSLRSMVKRALIPQKNGEAGNVLTEIYHFSRWRWRGLFRRTGWAIEERQSNHLFYTAYSLLDERLPLTARARLSRFMGGSCHVFVLRPMGAVRPAAKGTTVAN
jgi:SAM-dependent methyltransferase